MENEKRSSDRVSFVAFLIGSLVPTWSMTEKITVKSVCLIVYDTKHECNFLWKWGSMTQNVWHKNCYRLMQGLISLNMFGPLSKQALMHFTFYKSAIFRLSNSNFSFHDCLNLGENLWKNLVICEILASIDKIFKGRYVLYT